MSATNGPGAREVLRRQRLAAYVVPDFSPLWDPDLTVLPNGWAVAVADVGPDLAAAMLATNAGNQRNRVDGTVERYAADMAAGSWRLTHQGVAFNRAGELHDGQHRLAAVAASGATVPLLVFFGAGEQPEMSVIDTHRTRSAHDAARVLGVHATRQDFAVVNLLALYAVAGPGHRRRGLTHTEALALAERHRAALDATAGWFGGGRAAAAAGVSRAAVKAAVAAAYYHRDPDRLGRFVGVLTDVLPATAPGDGAAKTLRHYIQAHNLGGSAQVNADLYLRTCRAVQFFCDGVDPGRLYPAAEYPFPIPA